MSYVRRVLAAVCFLAVAGALIAPAGANDTPEPTGAPVAVRTAAHVVPQRATPNPIAPVPTSPDAPRASSIEEQLREAYEHAAAEEVVVLDAYMASLERTAELDAQIAELDRAIEEVSGQLAAAQEQLATARTALTQSEVERAEVLRQLAAARAVLESKAVSAYISGNARQLQIEMFLGASELGELESSGAYASAIVDDQLAAVARVRSLEAQATALRDERLAQERSISSARDAIERHQHELADQLVEVEALREEQLAELAQQAELLRDVRARMAQYLDRLHALERESDGIASVLRAAQASQEPLLDVPTLRTPLVPPVTQSSPFGMRVHPIFGGHRMHAGADFNGRTGDPIRSAAAGFVVLAASQDGYGNVVVVDHGNQLATVYAHMTLIGVRFGDEVERGQLLGTVGSTGYSTGPHLHFELRVSGAPIDPLPHVDFDEPLPGTCEALLYFDDPADLELAAHLPECAEAFEVAGIVPPPTTTVRPPTTTTTPRRTGGR